MASRSTANNNESEAAFRPTSDLLRSIVLDVLLHNSYLNTAKAFVKECESAARLERGETAVADKAGTRHVGVCPSDDAADAGNTLMQLGGNVEDNEDGRPMAITKDEEELVQLRRDIRMNILAGHVDEATQLLNTHFPTVLNQDEVDVYPSSTYVVPTHADPSSLLQARVNYTSRTSTNPIHVALNLRIQAFIEATRTSNLPNPPGYGRLTTSTPVLSSGESKIAHQTALLHRAQRLYAEVEALRDPEDKMVYREELKRIGGLLAYIVPEKSPLAPFLDQSRRDAVAEQVNSAILERLNRATVSSLELIVRQTSTVWSVLHDNKHHLPPPGLWPAGIDLLIRAPETKQSRTGGKGEKDGDVAPYFEFKDFLDA